MRKCFAVEAKSKKTYQGRSTRNIESLSIVHFVFTMNQNEIRQSYVFYIVDQKNFNYIQYSFIGKKICSEKLYTFDTRFNTSKFYA